ncbi:MAG: RNA polymerase sigma-70 factor [Ferruginibacter sp.]|nr:RNA polymerase sigma-70 factor [Ferruginibacter sp.]
MTNFTDNSDEELCMRLPTIEGEAAFSQLYSRYSERIYHNILRMVKDETTAEEILQDIFLQVWQKRNSIQIEKAFSGWLFTISRNRVQDFFRKIKRDEKLYTRLKSVAIEHYTHIEEAIFQKENAKLLKDVIDILPPQRRKVFELCKLDGLSYKEASEKMGVSLSTIMDHMAKARQTIREYIINNKHLCVSLCIYLFIKKI